MLIRRTHRAVLFYIFANLCKSSLMGDSWILLFASVFNFVVLSHFTKTLKIPCHIVLRMQVKKAKNVLAI